jgi:hypothetical protein
MTLLEFFRNLLMFKRCGSSPNSLIEIWMRSSQGPGRKGRLRRKPCTVLVRGKHRRDIAFTNLQSCFPQSVAEAKKDGFGGKKGTSAKA